MSEVRVIMVGLGQIGRFAVAPLLEKGARIVGAVDIDQELVGKDLAEVCGLDEPLGVLVSDDADAVMTENPADIVFLATSADLGSLEPQFDQCMKHNLNVISSSAGSVITQRRVSDRIDAKAKMRGITIAQSGMQDVFLANITTCLAGACHKVDRIELSLECDLDHEGEGPIAMFGINQPREDVEPVYQANPDYMYVATDFLEVAVTSLGLTPAKTDGGVNFLIADDDRVSAGGIAVQKGRIEGIVLMGRILTEEGVDCQVKISFVLYPEGTADTCPMSWSISGDPSLSVRTQNLNVHRFTYIQMVNRIPDVLNHAPGFIPTGHLPRPTYRARPLHYYVASAGS